MPCEHDDPSRRKNPKVWDPSHYWLAELNSLGVSPDELSNFSHSEKLKHLTESIKEGLYEQYKSAYKGKD